MISLKTSGIIVAAFIAGAFVASPVPQAIAAVIATDVQCTGCVGTSDLAGNAVTSAKIKDGEVKTVDLGANAVTSAKIKDGEVKTADIGTGQVTNTDLATGAVDSAKIADGTIAYADFSRSSIVVEHRDDCNCGGTGWDPDGAHNYAFIYDDAITLTSVVSITMYYPAGNCVPIIVNTPGSVEVVCNIVIQQGTEVNYAVFNHP